MRRRERKSMRGGGNTKYPKIQTIAKTPNLTEFLSFFLFFLVFGAHSGFLIFCSLFLALARSCSLLLARSCSLFLALPRSSSLFLALPWSCCVVFFCFSLRFVHFRFGEFVFALFSSFSVFFSIFHVFSLCLVLSPFLSLCLPSLVLFISFHFFVFFFLSVLLDVVTSFACSSSLVFNLSVWRCFYLQ